MWEGAEEWEMGNGEWSGFVFAYFLVFVCDLWVSLLLHAVSRGVTRCHAVVVNGLGGRTRPHTVYITIPVQIVLR